MEKLIRNSWHRKSEEPFAKAKVLCHKIHPEGLDVDRIRFFEIGTMLPQSGVGHIISVLKGKGKLFLVGGKQSFSLVAGIHLYIPPDFESVIEGEPGIELICVSGSSASQARGKKLLIRDETFLAACASENQSLRWIFTPQYLSRRVFLHHDHTLLSKSGNPVSWFRTTMFDVAGLPPNEEGEPVFKMAYNSRTECNVCYDVEGRARVRMAKHPYKGKGQDWDPWRLLDGDSTYHLNEAAGSPEEECVFDEMTRTPRFFRNKHEIHIVDGYVSLCCIFDPAPTGVERHRPGEYSDYEPLSQVLGTREYETHKLQIARFDEMVDQLSIAKATDSLDTLRETPLWDLYLRGREQQVGIESALHRKLAAEGGGREQILGRWMLNGNG